MKMMSLAPRSRPSALPPRVGITERSRASGAGRLPGGGEGRLVVGLGRDLLDVLRVLDLAVLADDEDGAGGEAGQGAVLDQDAVALGERVIAEVGQGLDVGDPCRSAPALLREGQVHA